MLRLAVALLCTGLLAPNASATPAGASEPSRINLSAFGRTSASLPAAVAEAIAPDEQSVAGLRSGWVLEQTVSKVLTGVSFADPLHGFISAELGGVYKTTNGGQNWTSVLNLGFPYYWYGVQAFSSQTVIIAGFNNQTGAGILRWTDNAGATWTQDIVLDPADWLMNIRFADPMHGIAVGMSNGYVYVTSTGGRTAADWTRIQADPTGGWFAGNFTFASDLRAYLTGISLCRSTDGGLSWTRRASADAVFDGGISFPDAVHGWTGGGQISSPVTGWVHRSTDGGDTWGPRIFQHTYPIRIVFFFDPLFGFAAGGTRFGNAGGGIWLTTDGGDSWTEDANTGAEMSAIDLQPVGDDSADVWCVGFLPSLSGVIYKKRIPYGNPAAIAGGSPTAPGVAVHPNPFARSTEIDFSGIAAGPSSAVIFDLAGREVSALTSADGRFLWDGRDGAGRPVAAGVYLVRHSGQNGVAAVRVVRLD